MESWSEPMSVWAYRWVTIIPVAIPQQHLSGILRTGSTSKIHSCLGRNKADEGPPFPECSLFPTKSSFRGKISYKKHARSHACLRAYSSMDLKPCWLLRKWPVCRMRTEFVSPWRSQVYVSESLVLKCPWTSFLSQDGGHDVGPPTVAWQGFLAWDSPYNLCSP